MHGVCARRWLKSSNAGLVRYWDWLFSAKETEDNKKRAPGPGASPELGSSSGKVRWKNAKRLPRLWAPWARQAEPEVLLASPSSPSGHPLLMSLNEAGNKIKIKSHGCHVPFLLLG